MALHSERISFLLKSLLFFIFILGLFSCSKVDSSSSSPLDNIKLPPSFKIQIFAEAVPGARSMCLSPKGILFVGTRDYGCVYAVVDKNRDNIADETIVIA